MVRVGVWRGEEFGGYTDFPDNCSIRTVAGQYESRGYGRMFSNHVTICMSNGDTYILIEERSEVMCNV